MTTVHRLISIILVAGLLLSCRPISPEGRSLSSGGSDAPAQELAKLESATTANTAPSVIEPDVSATAQAHSEPAPTESESMAGPRSESEPEPESTGDADAGQPAGTRWDDPALIAAGHQAYRDNYCGVCHRLAAAGTTGPFGPAHDEMGTVAAQRIADPNYRGAATDAAGYIRESIVEPNIYLVATYEVTQHRMPPYAHLEDDTIDAMVAFLLAQQ